MTAYDPPPGSHSQSSGAAEGYCGNCDASIGTAFCPHCGSAAMAPPTDTIMAGASDPPMTDLLVMTAQVRAARLHAGWALLGGALLAGIGIGTFFYSTQAGGLVWGGAAIAGGLLILRSSGRLWWLGARWVRPAVVVLAAGLVGVGFLANSAGRSHAKRAADHAVNDVSAQYVDQTTGEVYSETNLAQDLQAVCNLPSGAGVLVQNTKGDFGITDATGVVHEPKDTPACSDLALPRDASNALSLLGTPGK